MKRILIANRGEIARRVIRTAHAMGMETVAVHSDPDRDALHVREATTSFALGGTTSAESYLRIDRLLAAARATGADAIHPGYGFLSENAEFAQAVQQAGLTWIGPPPQAIRALGDKAGAKALARQAQVPCLPGYDGEEQSEELLTARAQELGYPIMVKAVAGGGGRGMRLVTQPENLAEAVRSAKSEALAAFGSDRVLLERALLAPRHVEVQVFADQHGHCIHLGERDCSVQRRNQKIIEEAPSPAVDAALRARMGQCAVQLAQAAGYQGAGTVEFLVEGGEFFLMEMNTRLQVEHPVTEALTGLDLVEWQIRVARGEPLPLSQEQVRLHGHAIEVRLCAEDENFVPCAGSVALFAAPAASQFCVQPLGAGPVLRFDHALHAGMAVTPYYDSMLGKLIVHAADRASAIEALGRALRQLHVLGLPTNRAFLAACLEHPTFRAGQALVPFLQTAADPIRATLAEAEGAALVPAVLATQLQGVDARGLLACALERPLRVRHRGAERLLGLSFGTGRSLRTRSGDDVQDWHWSNAAAAQGQGQGQGQGQEQCQGQGLVQLHREGVALAVRAAPGEAAEQWHVQTDGGAELWLEDTSVRPAQGRGGAQAATELRAPFNGRVIRVAAEAGQVLAADDTAVVIDSMKLEHSLSTGAQVRIEEVLVEAGQQVARGQLLLRLAPQAGT